jgi:GPI ethanolamine phosphate transferase 3 subunit O
MPTVTVVRVKNVITGGISTIFETTNEFIQEEVHEDNIFYQVKNNNYITDDDRIIFFGDHCWVPYFKSHFDEFEEFGTADTRDVDTLDIAVDKLILNKLEEGSKFKILASHIIGVDSSGHGYGSRSANLERKLIDSQKLIKAIMEKMDDQTTLVIFGDHGMTEDGNHGGNTDVELATVFFAYQKQPFPMYDSYRNNLDFFYNLDHSVKLGDVAAIISSMLDIPFPFSNMGNMHPLFA